MSLSYEPTIFSSTTHSLTYKQLWQELWFLHDIRIFVLGTDTVELLISYSQNDIMLLAGHIQQSPVES